MGSLADAMLKAKMVDPKMVSKMEKEKRAEEELENKKRYEQNRFSRKPARGRFPERNEGSNEKQPPKRDPNIPEGFSINSTRAPDTVHMKKLDAMWINDRTKKFMIHVIHSFTPLFKVDKIWRFGEKQEKKCMLCACAIMSVEDSFAHIKDKVMDNLREQIDFEAANKDKINDPEFRQELGAFLDRQRLEMFGNKFLGMGSDRSSKVFCFACLDTLQSWLMNKLICGDRELNGLVRSMMDKENRKRKRESAQA